MCLLALPWPIIFSWPDMLHQHCDEVEELRSLWSRVVLVQFASHSKYGSHPILEFKKNTQIWNKIAQSTLGLFFQVVSQARPYERWQFGSCGGQSHGHGYGHGHCHCSGYTRSQIGHGHGNVKTQCHDHGHLHVWEVFRDIKNCSTLSGYYLKKKFM